MLLALATHFGTADMDVVDCWIQDHGFDLPLKLTDHETLEAARRVHEEVQAAIAYAESRKKWSLEDSAEEKISEEESSDKRVQTRKVPNTIKQVLYAIK